MRRKIRTFLNLLLIILILTNIVLTAIHKTKAATEIEESIDIPYEPLEITFIDVGQADATLIRVNNKYMLIDSGNIADGDKLVKYFKEKGIEKFEYVIATHPHEDHIGGMKKIIENFQIDKFYMADVITTTTVFEKMLDALAKKNMSFSTFQLLEEINMDEAEFICLSNLSSNVLELNDSSIVLKMTYKETKYLFMADATNIVEKNMLKYDIKSDVLKVAHHGSKYSTNSMFLNQVNPKYAVISVGRDNAYKLPSEETLNRLHSKNIDIYRTDELGSIIMTSDGTNINIYNMKTDTDGGENEIYSREN